MVAPGDANSQGLSHAGSTERSGSESSEWARGTRAHDSRNDVTPPTGRTQAGSRSRS